MVGNTFTSYTTANSQIATDMIKHIAIGAGKVWMSTYGGGAMMQNGTTFTRYNTSNSGLPNNNAHGIAVDGLGNLRVASE